MIKNNKTQNRTREQVSEARGNIAEIGHLAKETVQDKYHELKDLAAEKFSAGKPKLLKLENSFADTIRGTPIKSILIAAGAGVLLSFLWRRR